MKKQKLLLIFVFFLFCRDEMAAQFVLAEQIVFSATSYRIKVFILSDLSMQMSESSQKAFVDTLRDRCRMQFGPLYELNPEFVRNETSAMLRTRFAEPPTEWEAFDKIFIAELTDGRSLHVTEYDTKTRFSAREGVYELEHPSKTIDTMVFALFEQTSPLAKLEKSSLETATLRIKGADQAALLSKSEGRDVLSLAGIEVQKSVLLPFVRSMDRNGKLIGVSRIPWTVLVPESIDPITGLARCRIQSSIRSSLGARRRGQTEIFALAVPTPMLPTRLKLQPRSESKQALPQTSPQTFPIYEVCEALPGGNKPVVIGRTQADGTFGLESIEDRPARTILIRSGRTLIAQVPVIRGLEPELTIPIPDDSVRLEAESVVLGIQEEMIDVAAQRSILRKRLEKYKTEKNEIMERETEGMINRLKSTDRFLIELDQARLKYKSDDPVVQRRIDKMFRDTRQALVGR